MQKQKLPSGQNQGYRYNGNNGTEGGGAGGGYPGPAMRVCPQGPGQPGTQHQDPKQAPQQTLAGGMPVSFSPTARSQNQYFQRHQRLNTPQRLTSVGNMPVPNITYVPQGQSTVYAPAVVQQIMMQQLPYQLSQTGGARQTHAPAPPATAGPGTGSYFPQQNPTALYIPHQLPPPPYYGPSPLFGIAPIRNNNFQTNSAPNPIQTQQTPPQQPQVVAGAGAANQSMMQLSLQPTGAPNSQPLMAGGQQGAQLVGQSPLIPVQQGGGGVPPSAGIRLQKDKCKRPNALMILDPDTGVDVIEEMLAREASGGGMSGSNSGQSRDDHHHSQSSQESSDAKVTKTKKDVRRPASIPTPPSSVNSQQHFSSISHVVQQQSVVQQPTPVQQPQPPQSQQQLLQQQPRTQHQQISTTTTTTTQSSSSLVKEYHHHPLTVTSSGSSTSTSSSSTTSKRESIQPAPVVQPVTVTSTITPVLPPPVTTHKSSFADSIDVKNFVINQPKPIPTIVATTNVEQKETNGETEVHESTSASSAAGHLHSSHGPNSALIYANTTKIMERKRRRKSKTRSNRSGSRRRDSRDLTKNVIITNNEKMQVCDLQPPCSKTYPTPPFSSSVVVPPQDLGGLIFISNFSNKAQQRPKTGKQLKKKDLNRKGVEKEGTDMDAFVETQTSTPPTATLPSNVAVVSSSVSPNSLNVTPATVTTVSTAAGTGTTAVTTTVIQQNADVPVSTTTSPITATNTSSTNITASSKSQPQLHTRQPSPSVEKRIPVIPASTGKQSQDETRDSISAPSSTSVTPVATTTSASGIPMLPTSSSTQSTPATTPKSEDSFFNSMKVMVAAKNQENTKILTLLNNNINNINNNNNNNNSNTIGLAENNNAKSINEDMSTQDAAASGGDSPQTGTGTIIETMTIERSQPAQLPYTYKEGQWSPYNTEGKKVYDREFLLEVRKNPLSSRKPNNHIDPEVCRDKPHDSVLSGNNRRNVHASNSMSLGGNRADSAVPGFMRSSQSQRASGFSNTLPYSQMISSKGGRGPGGGGPRMGGGGGSMGGSMRDRDRMLGKGSGSSFGGPMSPFRCEDPQLHKTANSWKSARNQDNKDKSDEELKTEKLLKAVRGILNKLTPQKFETLLHHILALPIDTNDRLTRVVHLVFSKAVDEPSFSKEYAELCRRLSLNKGTQQQPAQQSQEQQQPQQQQQQQQQGDQQQQQHSASFKKLLLNKCQEEFEKNKKDELNIEGRVKEIEDCSNQEKKKELKLQLEEEERIIRIKKVGLVRFIGELYKLKMLTNKIMHGCIGVLLEKIDEESLECLCKLLTTIGKELESMSDKKEFDQYFQKMLKLSSKSPGHSGHLVSSRIRFMLQDVIELRSRNWVPRRDENNPKTIEQIHKDAERETMLESALLSSQVGNSRSGGSGGRHDSRDDRRGRQRAGQSEDGWHSVVGSGKNFTKNSYAVEPSKLQHFKEIDGSMSLGSSNNWGQWMTGACSKKSNNPQVHLNNKFAALSRSDQDDRKPSLSMMNRKVITPSPSLEKDRAFAGIKEVLDSGRSTTISGGSSTGSVRMSGSGGGSGPPSRESSRLRCGSSLGGTTPTNITSSSSISGLPQTGGASNINNQTPVASQLTVPVTQNAPESVEDMSEERSDRETKTIILEWLDNNNIKETVQTVQDAFLGANNLVLFLRSALNLVLDHRKVIARPRTGYLLAVLVQENIIPLQKLIKEFAYLIELGDDIIVDIPHVWKYIGEILGPVIAQEVFSFADVRSTADQARPSKGVACTLAEIIKILIKDKGPGWIRTQWESSRVQMKDFVPEEDVDKFIKENNLGFIMGEGEVQVVADASLTPLMVEEKILSFLYKDNDKVLDHICDWLNANVGEKTKENDFIKALTRAVMKASLKGDRLSSSKLLKNEKLIKKFVDNDEGRELTCLYALQNLLVNELVQSPGVVLETFQTLYENGTISRDAFLRWRDDDEDVCDVEHAGKGVAIATLQSFFVSLSEQDESDEEAPS